ncbi:MAG: betaine/proline/choline family ABC transporter ATP-binding protein [Candidatus Bipolaricaulia bacterium]
MIRLEHVTKIYDGGTVAVDDVNFEINEGELCILVGPSGCGKTTTMKMINRLISITEGKIYIDGQDNTQIDVNELRRNIGYVIQEIGLFPHMTVQENIGTVPMLKRWSKSKIRERAEELLDLMGMDPAEFLQSYPSELSGGQRQRVGVARAMAIDPPIMLMDEPFGAIDPITRERLQDEFLKIQQEIRKTIVFVTHDINEAIKMGDKIALLKDGKLIQYDSPAELLSHPANDFVKGFVGVDRTLKGLRLMRVKDVMRRSPVTVKVSEAAEVIHDHMKQAGVRYLLVVEDDNKFCGWINLSDFEYRQGDRVKDVMTPAMETITPNTNLNEALSHMLSSEVGNIAVVDDDGQLVGVLTFNALREVLGETYTEKGGV